MKKRILSVLLCLCMVMALLPTTALAEGGEIYNTATLRAALQNGGTYTLTDTFTCNSGTNLELTAGKTLTITGDGQYTISLPATVNITTADGKRFTVPVTWSGYNPTTLDEQTLTGTLDLTAIEAEVDQPSSPITAQITVDLQERTAGSYDYQPKTAAYTGAPISHEIPALEGAASISYSYEGTGETHYGPSATAPTNAGSYQVTATFTMTAGYAPVAPKTAALTINKAEVAEPTVSGAYTYTGEEQTVALTGLESCMTGISGNTATNAGNYTVTITLDDNHQWAAGSDGSVAWSIGKAPVTVAARDQSIYIGQDVPDLTAPVKDTHYTVTGLLGSDSLNLAGVTMAYGETPDNSAVGTYEITVAGAVDASGNYAITYTAGTLTISARPYTGGSYTRPPTRWKARSPRMPTAASASPKAAPRRAIP